MSGEELCLHGSETVIRNATDEQGNDVVIVKCDDCGEVHAESAW